MAWNNCRKCGKLRKVDVVISSDGWHQPACYECGDPEYLEPLSEPVFNMRVPEQSAFSLKENDSTISHSPGLVLTPVDISDQKWFWEEDE